MMVGGVWIASAGPAWALGCVSNTPAPGHVMGNTGYTDVPTAPCPIGHYAALQKKRNSSALFAQPKDPNAPADPQTNLPQ